MLKHKLLLAVGLVIYSAIAQAATVKPIRRESVTTDRVDMILKGYCKTVSDVDVVMDGKKDEAFPSAVDPLDPCHWTAIRKLGTFDTEFARFSLRLGVARTTCRIANGDIQKRLAHLEFRCCKTQARLVQIQTPDDIAISYVRGVPQDLAYDEESIDCVETYPFVGTLVEIHSAWFSPAALSATPNTVFVATTQAFETVWIQFNSKAPDLKVPGLIINDPLGEGNFYKGGGCRKRQMRGCVV